MAAEKHDSIAEFRGTICSAIALTCTVFKTETTKYFTCGRFPTQASYEHLPVRKGRTTYKSHMKIYAHKKFTNSSSHTIISCERNQSQLAEIRLFAAKNLPRIVLEVDFGGSRGLLAIRLHFSYNYKLNKRQADRHYGHVDIIFGLVRDGWLFGAIWNWHLCS